MQRRSEQILFAALLAAFLIHAVSFRYTVDDAFISLRYAENWVCGDGLVFNPGEPVEGYTNFLWTVLMAGGIRIGVEPVLFSRVAGCIFGVLLLLTIWKIACRKFGSSGLAILVVFSMAANSSVALWSSAGLETSLFALLLFAGSVAATYPGNRAFLTSSLLLALASLTRPEGALVFAVLFAARWIWCPGERRTVWAGAALYTILMAPFEAWRIAYYGEPVPNTFYAKSGGGLDAAFRGIRYLITYFGQQGGWTALLPLPLLFLGGLKVWERMFLSVFIAWVAYVVWAGGDALPFSRFMVPAVPFVAILGAAGISRLYPGEPGRRLDTLRLAVLALLFSMPAYSSIRGDAAQFVQQDRLRVELHWKVIGRWLRENALPGQSIAVTTAGAIPYYSGLPAIDMLGITDKHIAKREMPEMGRGYAGHEKHDMDYVISRRPDFLLHYAFLLPKPIVTTSQFRSPWNRGLEELIGHEELERLYRVETAEIRNMHLVYFRLREDVK